MYEGGSVILGKHEHLAFQHYSLQASHGDIYCALSCVIVFRVVYLCCYAPVCDTKETGQ